MQIDLPGVDKDDVDLTIEHNVVNIRTERRPAHQEGDEVIVDERPYGTFTRQLFLGENLDINKLSADYDRGMLILRIPIAAESKPRRIHVGAQRQELRDENSASADQDKQPATTS